MASLIERSRTWALLTARSVLVAVLCLAGCGDSSLPGAPEMGSPDLVARADGSPDLETCPTAPCPQGLVCDVKSGECVQCLVDRDCGGNTPVCDAAARTCVQCLVDATCGFGHVCRNHSCLAGCGPQAPCSPGLGCCADACVPVNSDPLNCGACGNRCPMGSGCCGGQCIPLGTVLNCGACGNACGPGSDCCGGACMPVISDAKNCGACGNQCAMGSGCCGGRCTPLNNVQNCGACGTVCGPGSDCCGGQCTLLATSINNCGACGNVCAPGLTCQAGRCICMVNKDCAKGSVCCGGACTPGECCGNADCGDGKSCQTNMCGLDPGLIAWFKMDEGMGTTTADSSGFFPIFNTPTKFSGGVTWGAGVRNNALLFDGSGGVTIPDYYSPMSRYTMSGVARITIEAWINPVDDGFGHIGGRYGSILERGCDDHFALRMGGDPCNGFFCTGHVLAGVRVNNAAYFQIGSPSPIPAGTWTHAAMTYDGQDLKLYINGKLVQSTPGGGDISPPGVGAPGTKPNSASIDPTIGARYCSYPSLSYFYSGAIDEVRVYNYARTAQDIAFDAVP